MTRNYKDWTIEVREIDGSLGKGFAARCSIKKNNGLRENVRDYWVFQNPAIKTHTQMLNYAIRLLEVPLQ